MPNKYIIRFLRIAEEDLNGIIFFIAKDNIKAAIKTADRIEEAISRLETHPFLGRIPDDLRLSSLGYRYLIIDNYLVFYTIEDKKIIIHRIIHGAREYKSNI